MTKLTEAQQLQLLRRFADGAPGTVDADDLMNAARWAVARIDAQPIRREDDVTRAARGFYTELEIWIALLIRLADDRMGDDADYQVLRRLMELLGMTSQLASQSLADVLALIQHNRKPST
jgi:hypothetical protein